VRFSDHKIKNKFDNLIGICILVQNSSLDLHRFDIDEIIFYDF